MPALQREVGDLERRALLRRRSRANSSNLKFMKLLVIRGPNKHPEANFVEKKFLKFADR